MKQRKRKIDQLAEILNPSQVKVLILTEQKISMKDFFFIRNFSMVKKLDLSYNKLTNFPVGFSFRNFTSLSILYLHYNKFTHVKSLTPISQSPILEYLTLFGNPLQQAKVRHFIVNQILTLKLMDDKIVKLQQRSSDIFDQGTNLIKFPFPIIENNSNDTTSFLQSLMKQLIIIRRAYLIVNPIIIIQRYWRNKVKNKRQYKYYQRDIKQISTKINNHKQLDNNRLITQKYQISRSSQQIVMSLFTMNLQFWQTIKQFTDRQVYGLRQHCIRNQIPYKQIHNNLIVLKTPTLSSNKKFLQFFIQSASMFLIKKIGNSKIKFTCKNIKFKKSKPYKLTKQQEKIYITTYNKILKRQNSYNQLVLVDLPAQRKIKIIKNMYQRCKTHKSIFPFIFNDNLQRNVAAVTIQSIWRGYSSRKKLQAKKMIQQNRAAKIIQKWIKNLSFQHRRIFLIDCCHYLRQQTNKQIIIKAQQIKELQKSQIRLQKSINFVIPFQKISFRIQNSKVQYLGIRSPYPAYLQKYVSFLTSTDFEINVNIYDLLFKGSIKIYYSQEKGIKYCKFCYQNVEQARNRKFLLALITYRIKNHNFIKSKQIKNIITDLYCINDKINDQFIVAINQQTKLQNLQWHKIKVRYHNGKQDYSCILKVSQLIPKPIQKQIIKSLSKSTKIKKIQPIHHHYLSFLSQQKPNTHRQLKTDKSLLQNSNSILQASFRQQQSNQINYHQSLQKRKLIKNIKDSHIEKLTINSLNKKQYLKKIRQYFQIQQLKNQKIQEIQKQTDQYQKIKKYKKIRVNNRYDDSFQKQFINKGNSSIKIQLLKFQKNINFQKNSIKQLPMLNHSLNNSRVASIISRKKHYQNIVTQIKQFSPHPSQSDLVNLSSFRGLLSSNQTKKQISRYQEDLIQQNNMISQSSINKKQFIRPNKLIHSVFPEEFYPLKQTKKIEFELPKLKQKK